MAAKKKPAPVRKIQDKTVKKKASTSKPKSDMNDLSDNEFLARSMARDVSIGWLKEPRNRSQVIMPPGANFTVGSDAYYLETKGRFRGADEKYGQVYRKARADLKKLNPAGETKNSRVTKTSTKAKKKK